MRKLPQEYFDLLGKVPASELIRQFGVTRSMVEKHRKKLGVNTQHLRSLPRQWSLEELALLRTMNDSQVGRKLGIHNVLVGKKRKQMGIRPVFPAPPYLIAPHVEWDADSIAMLGRMSDSAVAQIMGIHYSTVASKRKSLNLPKGKRTSVPVGI